MAGRRPLQSSRAIRLGSMACKGMGQQQACKAVGGQAGRAGRGGEVSEGMDGRADCGSLMSGACGGGALGCGLHGAGSLEHTSGYLFSNMLHTPACADCTC
mgnify:CR=1 FL=1